MTEQQGNDQNADIAELSKRLFEGLKALQAESPIDAAYQIADDHTRYAGRLIAEGSTTEAEARRRLLPIIEGYAIARARNDDEVTDELIARFTASFDAALEQGITRTQTFDRIREAIDYASLASKYAQRIWKVTEHGNKLIHTATAECVLEEVKLVCVDLGMRKQFYQYDDDGGKWEKVTTMTVKKIVVGIIGDAATDSTASAVVGLVAIMCEVRQDAFNAGSHLINLRNTAFDLDLYKPVPHKPQHYFTYHLTYEYDAEATCSYTDSMLSQYAMHDPAWINCFWEMAGFCLQADYFVNKMFWLVGDGSNGKSTVQKLLHELIGHSLTKTGFRVSDLGKDFYLYSVIGKRMALCGDAAVRMDNMDLLKQFTGGDALSTNVKFGDYVQFENTAKLILCMNRAPLISSHEALKPITRRIIWLPFEYRILQPDPSVDKKMLSELPGAFNRAVEGLVRLRRQGTFTKVDRGEKALSIWAGTANLLEVFISENVRVRENEKIRLGQLWDIYRKWMDQWGGRLWESDPYNIRSAHQLSREIIARYGCKKEYEQCRYYSADGHWISGKQVFLYGIGLSEEESREVNF
jgi:P4 family phage/plasmid primase-like protien